MTSRADEPDKWRMNGIKFRMTDSGENSSWRIATGHATFWPSLKLKIIDFHEKKKPAMMTLQGMADHRFTSVSLFTNVFLGDIIFFP